MPIPPVTSSNPISEEDKSNGESKPKRKRVNIKINELNEDIKAKQKAQETTKEPAPLISGGPLLENKQEDYLRSMSAGIFLNE